MGQAYFEEWYYVQCNDINELLSMLDFGEPGLPYIIDWAVPNLKEQKIFPVYVHTSFHKEIGILLSEIRESKPLNEYSIIVKYKDFSRYEKAEIIRAAKNN